jgi:hypothetical protein
MSRGYRSVISAIVGIASIVAFVVYGLSEQSRYAESAYYHSTNYARLAADQINHSCLKLTSSRQLQCLREGADRLRLDSQDKQREYEDLMSQRKSALWAMIMGIAALIGMALSIIGVGLVYTTFVETRRAANAAHEANRPWLQVEITENDKLEMSNTGAELTTQVRITNVGNSPATYVNAWAILYAEHGNSTATLIHGGTNKAKEWLGCREGELGKIDGTTIFPNASMIELYTAHIDWADIRGAVDAKSVFLSYAVGVIYHFGGSTGHTISSFDVWPMRTDNRIVPIPEPNDRRSHLVRLLDNMSSFAD